MQVPLEVRFVDVEPTGSMRELIHKKAAKLQILCPELISCRIGIEAPHRSRKTGNQYRVSIDMTVPGREFAVAYQEHDFAAHDDIRVSINRAFQRAERRLETYTKKRRRQVKKHEVPGYAHIASVSPQSRSGTLETPDGRVLPFTAEEVLDGGFDRLREGMSVQFGQRTDDAGIRVDGIFLAGS